MKVAISNIAWETTEDAEVAKLLRELQVEAIELAPTKYWPAPCSPTASSLQEVRKRWEDDGIRIVAMQSLLFGMPELSIFGEPDTRRKTAAYLEQLIRVAEQLGARTLVFGSPKNRDRGQRTFRQAIEEAAEFLGPVARYAGDHGCVLGWEPNPTQYKCNFCTNVAESLRLLQAVNHPGLRLHLDIGIAHLNGEDIAEVARLAQGWLAHVHVSEPELGPVGVGCVDHTRAAEALRAIRWDGYVSIEMRADSQGSNLSRMRTALEMTKRIYGG